MFDILDIFNQVAFFLNQKTLLKSNNNISFDDILDKTTFSDGLKKSLKNDLEKSGYKNFSELKGETVSETQKNIENKVDGFSSGKNTYLQARHIAKVIHGVEDSFASGGKVSKSHKQYAKEVDAYKWFIINIEKKKAESGWEYRSDADEALQDYDGDANYKVVAEKTLSKYGIENPKEKWKKFEKGGNIVKDDVYWEKRENLERFLSYNDDDIYWRWINEEISDNDAIALIKEIHGIKFNPDEKYVKGGAINKIKDYLVSEGNSNVEVVKYNKDWWKS